MKKTIFLSASIFCLVLLSGQAMASPSSLFYKFCAFSDGNLHRCTASNTEGLTIIRVLNFSNK